MNNKKEKLKQNYIKKIILQKNIRISLNDFRKNYKKKK